VKDQSLERLASLRHDEQAARLASGGERLLDRPPAGDQLLVLADEVGWRQRRSCLVRAVGSGRWTAARVRRTGVATPGCGSAGTARSVVAGRTATVRRAPAVIGAIAIAIGRSGPIVGTERPVVGRSVADAVGRSMAALILISRRRAGAVLGRPAVGRRPGWSPVAGVVARGPVVARRAVVAGPWRAVVAGRTVVAGRAVAGGAVA
jgi:hypothetical protein